MWLPDTNVWIAYLNPKPSVVKQAMRAHPASAIYLCDIVKAELLFGAYKSQRMEANLAVLAHQSAPMIFRSPRLLSPSVSRS